MVLSCYDELTYNTNKDMFRYTCNFNAYLFLFWFMEFLLQELDSQIQDIGDDIEFHISDCVYSSWTQRKERLEPLFLQFCRCFIGFVFCALQTFCNFKFS